jgi:hypothetical protein
LEFDLSKPSALSAYENFFKGKLDFSKKLPEGVVGIIHEDSKTRGRFFDAQALLPVLAGVEFRDSTTFTNLNLTPFPEKGVLSKRRVETFLGVYAEIATTYGPITRHLNKEKLFASSYQNAISPEGTSKDLEGFSASLKWYYQRERIKDYNWDHEIKELELLTGKTSGDLDFLLPGRNLGLVKMEFDVVFPHSAIKKVMDDLEKSNDSFEDALWPKVVSKVVEDHCSLARTNLGRRICTRHFSQGKAEFSKGKFEKKLKNMALSWGKKDPKSFIKSFTAFGKLLTHDPYTFQTFLALVGEDNYCTKFSASGDQIKPVTFVDGKGKGCE